MNAAKTEAIANADAHLSNAGLPTYTEMARVLEEATDRLSVLINAGRHEPRDAAVRDKAHRLLQGAFLAL